jgi:uncharacterized protein
MRVAAAAVERRLGVEPGPGLQRAEQEWQAGMHPPAVNVAALEDAALAGRTPYSARLRQPLDRFLTYEWVLIWVSSLDLSGMMLLGMALLRMDFFTGELPRHMYVRTAWIGLLASVPWTLLCVWQVLRSGLAPEAVNVFIYAPMEILRIGTVLALAALMVLWARSGKGRFVAAPLAAVGRMALSNYILTSLICQWIFAWGPWQLYGEVEYYQQYLVVLAVWAFNIVFSVLWLRWFSFGPLEWLWRSLTYGGPQPMLSAARATGQATTAPSTLQARKPN